MGQGTGRVECPGCHTPVRAKADGGCPSCGADTRGARSDIVRMVVTESMAMPDRCARCGEPATTSVRLEQKRATRAGEGWWMGALRWLGLMSGLLLIGRSFRRMIGPRADGEDGLIRRLSVAMPSCAPCARLGAPEIVHVDYARGEIAVLVHRAFRKAARRSSKRS